MRGTYDGIHDEEMARPATGGRGTGEQGLLCSVMRSRRLIVPEAYYFDYSRWVGPAGEPPPIGTARTLG